MQSKSDGNMADRVTENFCSSPPILSEAQETHNAKTDESAENFQKFMYELFEKNGVLNDLRAYLRGHIVGILRNARTGDSPACQKHFTQRLKLPYQALNMLLAEYMLRMEFTYSLSVFISEMPLANMVLDFAKSLMQGNPNNAELRFKDEDVWSILNYLGVRCDSEHASSIVEMYRQETHPLLFCMLKYMPLYTPVHFDKVCSEESLSSSVKSSDTIRSRTRSHHTPSRCKHLVFCKTCHGKIIRMKEKYNKKKKTLAKNSKESRLKPRNVDTVMQDIDAIERNLVDEMFQQLKSVYESEMQMVKAEEEERVKRSLASHALQLKKKWVEMEDTFKARESELAESVQQKKRFLWGLAQLLRDQHQQLARAMRDVQAESNRLAAKEDSLKSQLAEAEEVLRARGAEMRCQISAELAILEKHLDSMKQERDTITRERSELEHLRHLYDTQTKPANIETTKEQGNSHHDLLKNEFDVLKKYLETIKLEPKCFIERGTLTEDDLNRIDRVLNNGQDLERSRSEDRVKAKQVVNDLKKMKNVNFSQSNVREVYQSRGRSSPSRPPAPEGEAGDLARRLLEENERLRTFARQQREHIDELSSHQARLQAELTAARAPPAPPPRPRTAPAAVPNNSFLQRTATITNSNQPAGYGWRKGAGEEMSFFVNTQPRILVPGDTLPFIGVVRDRHNDNRRHLINQWRTLRRRGSPESALGKSRTFVGTSATRDADRERASSAGPRVRIPSEEDVNNNDNRGVTEERLPCDQYDQIPSCSEKTVKPRDKSPRLTLREAKEKLKCKEHRLQSERERSPAAVIRDAKLRLRKLEIEAEAVEKSYLDFRRRRGGRRGEGRTDLNQTSSHKADNNRMESSSGRGGAVELVIEDIDEYHRKYDIGATRFGNKIAAASVARPIPASPDFETTRNNRNYLDASMTEFRKYYHSEKRTTNKIHIEERPRMENSDVRFPSTSPFISPRLDEGVVSSSPVEHRRVSTESENLPRTSLSHNADSNGKNELDMHSNKDDISTDQANENDKRKKSPKTKNYEDFRNELLRQTHNKAKELEILKQNISKIYNLSDNSVTEHNDNCNEAVENATWEVSATFEKPRRSIIEEMIPEASPDGSEPASKEPEDKNLIRIEVQSVSQLNDVKITESLTQDVLLVVESSKPVENSDIDFQNDILSTQMTILVSPGKQIDKTEECDQKVADNSGEKSTKLAQDEVINSLYHAEKNENVSSVHVQLEGSKDVLVPFLSDDDINDDVQYADDFTADIDNVNSLKYDTDNDRSPISMAKTFDDDNFWDS